MEPLKEPLQKPPSRTSANAVRAAHGKIRKTNYFESILHLIKANVGAGIFALGGAVKNAGLICGALGTIFLGLVCCYNMHTLVRSANHVKDKMDLEFLPNFPETVELCFLNGPLSVRPLTKHVKIAVRTCIICTQMGFCSIYIVFVASSIMELMADRVVNMPKLIHIYILMILPLVLLTALIPSLKFLAPLSLVANLLILTACVISIYLCTSSGFPSIFDRHFISPSITTWPLFFGTAIFAFESISLIIPLHNEMKNPKLFYAPYGVLNVGMTIVILGTTSMGFFAYWKFGEDIMDSVTLNFDDGPIPMAVKILVACGIMLTYAIHFHIGVDVMWWDIVRVLQVENHVLLKELGFRLCVSSFTLIMAASVPYLGLFLSLIGSVFSNALALFFPALCDIVLRTCPKEEGRIESSHEIIRILRLILDGCTLLIAVCGCLTGATTSIIGLVNAFKTNPSGQLY